VAEKKKEIPMVNISCTKKIKGTKSRVGKNVTLNKIKKIIKIKAVSIKSTSFAAMAERGKISLGRKTLVIKELLAEMLPVAEVIALAVKVHGTKATKRYIGYGIESVETLKK